MVKPEIQRLQFFKCNGRSKLKEHQIVKRYWLIGLLSYWQGQVNGTQPSDHFDLSITQGKKYFAKELTS